MSRGGATAGPLLQELEQHSERALRALTRELAAYA